MPFIHSFIECQLNAALRQHGGPVVPVFMKCTVEWVKSKVKSGVREVWHHVFSALFFDVLSLGHEARHELDAQGEFSEPTLRIR